MQRIVVVLPAPFGPRKPVTLPDSIPNVRLSTAVLGPYRLVRPRTSIMGNWSSLANPRHHVLAPSTSGAAGVAAQRARLRRSQFWPAGKCRRVTPGDDLPGTPAG